MREDIIPIIIPVYNTPPETLYIVALYLRSSSRNPIVVVNDGSNRDETIQILKYIREKEYVIVLDKENGGKIDALLFGVEYVIKQFNPRCVFVIDDDIIPYSMTSKSLDDILYEYCMLLDDPTPVAVFPVANQIYVREKILENLSSTKLENPFGFSFTRLRLKPNILDYIQNVEHIVSSNHARLVSRNGLWIGGSGSLWLTSELRELLLRHSREHAADDLELSILLLRRGKDIAFFNNLTLYAELVSKPLKFVKQRIYWSYGAVRVLVKHPDLLLPKQGSSPLYTMYILNAYVFLALLTIPIPIVLKEAIGVFYGALLSAQTLAISMRQLGKIFVLVGGVLVSTPALATSLVIRVLAENHELANYTMLLGALFSLIYTLAVLYRANSYRNNYLKLRSVDLLILAIYAFIYSLVIMPAGLILYIYRKARKTRKTYKIT